MNTYTASATYLRSLANAEEDHSSFRTLHDQVSVSLAADLLGCGEKEICLMQGTLYCRVSLTWGKGPHSSKSVARLLPQL